MQLQGLLDRFILEPAYRDLINQIQAQQVHHFSVIRSARPFLIAAIRQQWDGPIIFITAQARRAYNISEQLPVWIENDELIHQFAEPTPQFYDRLPWDESEIQNRLITLNTLFNADTDTTKPIICLSAKALIQRTLPIHQFRKHKLTLEVGKRYVLDRLLSQWTQMGYESTSMVVKTGQFSRRGGILDIYPLASPYPIRLDFFDDELESLRNFDINSQRSLENLDHVHIIPAREALPADIGSLGQHLTNWIAKLETDESFTGLKKDIDALSQSQTFPYLEHYAPYFYNNPFSILDYAPDNTLVIIEDIQLIQEHIQHLIEQAEINRENNIKTHQIADDHPKPYIAWDQIETDLASRHVLHLSSINSEADGSPALFSPGPRFGGQIKQLLHLLKSHQKNGETSIVVTAQSERLTELWYQEENSDYIPVVQEITEPPLKGQLLFVDGSVHEGWRLQLKEGALHLLSDAEIFNWSRPEPRRRKTNRKTQQNVDASIFNDWKIGDFIVHVDYGIGRFAGLMSRTIEGTQREYLQLEYDSGDSLYVPIHQAERVTRYVGISDLPPRMSRLGKQIEWTKIRAKAQKIAEEEAKDLLDIYAKRVNASRHSYGPDNVWQYELEASFPYVETEDQLRVLQDIKRDMESNSPMDRLICGDVGYGKTEVALRAAFKAVTSGKQVAILVPTTVLSQQHYETFRNRLEPFPIKVEMLSRFRTAEQQSQILTKLVTGEIDIIIGTHRLLSEDVSFKELGLVIIDEEQRFGVKHKEHFKKFRANIDVLALTATPIPRTLYMSLSGIRDISMLQTPPEERLPIITHVGPFDKKLIRQAILREIDRGGQVFVIHNRVKTIDTVKAQFEEIVPEASIIIGHGQMSSRQLEAVMSSFSRGEYDILLSTTIIESGIDMPTVNTLIIDRADGFGMSQLYQLRGRVGRSAQQAYAYLFHPKKASITQEAFTRLETLAEHENLGAGFQIAMRDLELRGAGDILSTKQSGQVSAVGLHLYTQLLNDAVKRLKREISGEADTDELSAAAKERVIIDLPLAAYLPTDWIPEMAIRLQVYRRIGSLQNDEEIELMREELRDRFGKLPGAVEGLLYVMQIKLLAEAVNASAIIKPRQHILIKLPYLAGLDRQALALHLGKDIDVTRTDIQLNGEDDIWQWRLPDILKKLKEGLPEMNRD